MKRAIYVAEVDAIVHFDDEHPGMIDIEQADCTSMGTWDGREITLSFWNATAPGALKPLNAAVRAALLERKKGGPCLDVPRPTPWERPKRKPYTGPVATAVAYSFDPVLWAARDR